MGAVIVVAVTVIAVNAHGAKLADVRRELSSLAFVLSDHVDRTSESVVLTEGRLIDELTASGAGSQADFTAAHATQAVHLLLKKRIGDLPYVDALLLVGNDGRTINSTRSWPPPSIDLAGQGYFKTIVAPNGPSVMFAPVRSRVTDVWGFVIARRVSTADGRQFGVLLAFMKLDYLRDLYSHMGDEESGRAISLIRTDGVLIARYPILPDQIGRSFANEPVLSAGPHAGSTDFTLKDTSWDGVSRYVATQRSKRFPTIVNASATVAVAMKSWTAQRNALVLIAGLLELCLLAIVLAGLRLIRNRAVLAAARDKAASELSLRDRRMTTALDNMSQGLCMFDGADRLHVVNGQWTRLFQLPPAATVVGTPIGDFIAACVHPNGLAEDQAERIKDQLLALGTTRQDGTFALQLPDGRSFAFSFRSIDENAGWVLTCEDFTRRHQAEQRILHMARHDPLTNLPNRALLRDKVEQAVARLAGGEAFALLHLDLDKFKAVNDVRGYAIGDALLQDVARRLLRCVRDTDTVARIGADEFAVLHWCKAPPDATSLAERITEELGLPYDIVGHQIAIGASIGVTVAPSDGHEPDQLLKNGDLALYLAKQDGGGCHRFFEPSMDAYMRARRALENDLQQALRRREFRVFFQPLVDRDSRLVVGFEALVRWQHPVRGLLGPNHFIDRAEEMGVIGAIGEWVLLQACAEAAQWPGNIRVAVNLSSHQFGKGAALIHAVEAALARSGLEPCRLELEITESVLLQETGEVLQTLHALKQIGVRIALDDFGTGYSSLSYLQKFPFDKIKIDQSFIRGMATRHDCSAIVYAISGLCLSLGIAVTAEGVETEEQMRLLMDTNCQEIQGYLFSRPGPADEVGSVIGRLGHRTAGSRVPAE